MDILNIFCTVCLNYQPHYYYTTKMFQKDAIADLYSRPHYWPSVVRFLSVAVCLAIITLPLDMNLLGLPFTKFTWSLSTWVTKKVVLWFVKYRVNQHTMSSSSNTQVSPVQFVNCKPCLMSWCLIKQCLCPWTLHPVNGKRNNFTVLLSQLLDSLNVAKNHSNSIFVYSTTLFHVMRLCYNTPKNFY